MSGVLSTLIPVALLALALVLALGLWNMMRGGSTDRSQKLMRWRILIQFVVILLVMASVYLASTNN
ncbi:twin transmembrane helix small protein [Flexibacterium corallicola]|uniref:twin transmembrane helix small protein n=1 Tax=Flexibacterium corallicola TaxID=3037259 RepID=UPI00286F4392|nr:twin transmembrane helix small protein [Pseudovibrio sp. M1P-2-3]